MHWNYRAIRHTDVGGDYYAIHEVFYDDKDKPTNCTEQPVSFTSQEPAQLIRWLEQAIKNLKEYPVFEPPKVWDHAGESDVCPFCNRGG